MKTNVSPLIVSVVALLLGTTCVTVAFWSGTVGESQINRRLDGAPQSVTPEPRVLLLQSASGNVTQPSRASLADNISRIIVPISKVENTSNTSAQASSGFELPTWLWIPVILILLVVLAYLVLKLLREGDNEPPFGKQAPSPPSTSETSGDQLRQIPVGESERQAEPKNGSAATSEIRNIPIDASEEPPELDKIS